jgi:hypothetical protein
LKGKFTPSYRTALKHVKEESMLEYLAYYQYAGKAQKQDSVLFIVKFSAKPRKRNAKR